MYIENFYIMKNNTFHTKLQIIAYLGVNNIRIQNSKFSTFVFYNVSLCRFLIVYIWLSKQEYIKNERYKTKN